MDDWQLIESYARDRSEASFRALVERHAGLVYASALRQVREPHLAEEVSQAVFILLSHKAKKLSRNTVLSGWLFQTTRFVAQRAMRSESRRLRREKEAFDMQQLTSTDETWQQLTPVVDEALTQLNRSDRDAILLRYFEGQSLKEVSSSLGISEDAAKKRVTRAVEKLRQSLGRKGTAISIAMLSTTLAAQASATAPAAVVLSLAARAAASTQAPAVNALVNEVLAAWRWVKLKWLAGATVAVVSIAVLVTNLDSPFGSSSARRTEAGPPIGFDSAAADSSAQPAASSEPARNDLKRLTLRVVAADSGKPVTGARVFLTAWSPSANDDNWNLTTDASGVCLIDFPPDAGRIDVGVLQDGFETRYVTWPSEGAPGIASDYVLKLATVTNVLGGTLLDPDGMPLPDAVIWFQGRESNDYSHYERKRERFGFLSSIPATRTDPQGRWSISFIPPAHRGFQLQARHPDYADTSLASSSAQTRLQEIESEDLKQLWAGQLVSRMNPAHLLSGIVVDEMKRPIVGAKVRNSESSPAFISDASGTFTVPKLKPGGWAFTATADGYAPVRTEVLIGPTMPPVVVTLRTGAVLRLRVVDIDGLPVPDAEVGMEQWGIHRYDIGWRERTDFDGRIEWISAPREVTLDLFARKDGYCYTRDVKVVADGTEHTITIQPALEVYGRVLDAEGGWGLRDFKAVPGYGGSSSPGQYNDLGLHWYEGSTVRGTNGLFKLSFTEKKFPWRVRVSASGYEDWVSDSLTNRGPITLDIGMRRAHPTNTVRGIVLLPNGMPASGAEVALLSFEHSVNLRRLSFEGNARWLTKADVQGRFSFPAQTLAHSVAAVSAAGYAHLRFLDTQESVTLRLEPFGRVEGIVDASAAELGVASVELYDPAAQNYQGRVSLLGFYSATPGADRSFVFENVPPGEFCVFVNSMNGIPYHHRTPVTVLPGQTARVVIREHPGARVTGQLLPPAERPIHWKEDFILAHFDPEMPLISALNSSEKERHVQALEYWSSPAGREHILTRQVYAAHVKADGTFASLENIPPGRYRFSVVFRKGEARQEITIDTNHPPEIALGTLQLR